VRIARETAVHGRETELAALRDAYEQARAGQGRMLLVQGEAGIGKTRLVDEFLGELEAADEEVNVLTGAYPPGGAATSTAAFCAAFREHFAEAALEDDLQAHLQATPALVPAFAALLRGAAAPAGSPALSKDAAHTAFVELVRSLAAERPTVLWVDDLHAAPDEGRGLLTALALAVPGHRVLLIATSRRGLPPDWTTTIDVLEQCERLAVSRMRPEHVEALIGEALRSPESASDLSPRIVTKADGNPFVVLEILKELRTQGVLSETDDGHWRCSGQLDDIQIPSSVVDLVEARLAHLSDEERTLLDVAACVGFEFDPLLVGDVLGLARIPLLTRLAQIERRHRLIRSVGRHVEFDQHPVRDALVEGIPELLTEGYHAAIADALEARAGAAGADPKTLDGELAVRLCHHLLHGAEGKRALRYLAPALKHLEQVYLHHPAIALADRALAEPGLLAGDDRVRVLVGHAQRVGTVGRMDRQHELLLEAQTSLSGEERPRRLTVRVDAALGWNLMSTGRLDEAIEVLGRAREEADAIHDTALRAETNGSLGEALLRRGRTAESIACHERAIELHEAGGDRLRAGRARGSLASAISHLGRYQEAVALCDQQLATARDTGDRRGELAALLLMAALTDALGRRAEAVDILRGAVAMSREIGERRTEGHARGNLGSSLGSMGLLEEARRNGRRSLEIVRETGDQLAEALLLVNLGGFCSQSGDPDEAQELLESAVALAARLGSQRELAWAHVYLGSHMMRYQRWEEARSELLTAEGVARAMNDVEALTACHAGLGELHVQTGDLEEAQRWFDYVTGGDLETAGGLYRAAILSTLAPTPLGNVPAAAAAVIEHEDKMAKPSQVLTRYSLYRATHDPADLEKAYQGLMFLRNHVGDAYRERIIQNVPKHREIVAAWEAARAGE
jgi:tetratricopeptide (TPR) repeat protein